MAGVFGACIVSGPALQAESLVPQAVDFSDIQYARIAMAEKPDLNENLAEVIPSEKPTDDKIDDADEETSNDQKEAEEKTPVNYIGDIEVIDAKFEDTLLELGRQYNLGYVEIVAANPGVDPWLPGKGTKVTLPKRHLIPDGASREGLVINLAEMRMYDFVTDPENLKTYPLGIGRDGLNTPTGETKVTWKKEGPTWRPTPRMREEDPELPEVVPPGEDNPLGTHALYLGWPQYLIHGTHKPLGVGRRVSSGCIRMYPEDIVKVFENIPAGTKVSVIKQPIKFAWIDEMLYMEAHAEDDLADAFEDVGKITEYRVPETLFTDVQNAAGEATERLDWEIIRDTVKKRQGIPVAILLDKPTEDIELSEDLLNEPAVEEKPVDDKKEVRRPRFND